MTDTPIFLERAAMAVANCLTIGWDGIHRDKAHWRETHGMLDGIYHEVNDLRQDDCREAASAALFAFRQWLADEGLVVVPAEPTPKMLEANSNCTTPELWAGIGWAAMIAAALKGT